MNAQQLRREAFNQAKNHEMILAVRYNAKASTSPLVSVVVIAHRSVPTFMALLVGFIIV